ncbi:hypothetical protein ACHAXS_004931 [Conticribra weissflogii]
MKLTDCLIKKDTVPLASIASTHVKLKTTCAFDAECIERVEFINRNDESPIEGSVMLRLYSFGVLLYELFSGHQLPPLSSIRHFGDELVSHAVDGITLADNSDSSTESSDRGAKSRRNATLPNAFSESLLGMGMQGIPRSIISLVQNLLDSGEEDFCPDGAYTSFSEVRTDLRLMMYEPTRFLHDTVVNPQLPLRFSGTLCGREKETDSLRAIYENFSKGHGNGYSIPTYLHKSHVFSSAPSSLKIEKGSAGVGKTKLAGVVEQLTTQMKGYFLCGKFEQTFGGTNLSMIAAVFDRYLELFARDMTHKEKEDAALMIENSLGEHLTLLLGILPKLSRLIPRRISSRSMSSCMDQDSSVAHLLGTCLNILTSHSTRPITAFLDDIQWADNSSLRLLQRLLQMFQGNKRIFFALSCRNEDIEANEALSKWIQTIPENSLTALVVSNLEPDGVNRLVCDTLHLFPRLTRPLASVIFHKTRGNPFFIGQMLNVMKKNRILIFRLESYRWEWDMEKVMDVEVPNTVLELLSKEMNRLPRFLQEGLKVSSCIGRNIFRHLIDLVPLDLGLDRNVLKELSERGFLDDLGSGGFRFTHDKMQEAAYDTMALQEKCRIHSILGLTFSENVTTKMTFVDDEILFSSAFQLLMAGADMFTIEQRLNLLPILLIAGKMSLEKCDLSVAFASLDCATSSFFDENFWVVDYDLSLDLFNTATEVACCLNEVEAVICTSKSVLKHARLADQYDCQYLMLTSLKKANQLQDAVKFGLNILQALGEDFPSPLDPTLLENIQCMKTCLRSISDETLLSYKCSHDAELIIKMKLLMELNQLFLLTNSSQIAAVSLHAFANFGLIALSIGDPNLSYRLGTLTLKMIETFGAMKYKSLIFGSVHMFLSWIRDPFQLVSEMLKVGIECGRKAGDDWGIVVCRSFGLHTSYLAGENLVTLNENMRKYILKARQTQHSVFFVCSGPLHCHISTLLGDFAAENSMKDYEHIPYALIASKCYHLARAVYFRHYDGISLEECNISKEISETNSFFRPTFIDGIFFSGLISFYIHRETKENQWMKLGVESLASIKYWSAMNCWNFEGKVLMLEAEEQFALGNVDDASRLYDAAIRSSRAHRFINDEALANDLAGMHYHGTKSFEKSFRFLRRAAFLYREWGACAVANRVDSFIEENSGEVHLMPVGVDVLRSIAGSPKQYQVDYARGAKRNII